MKGFDIWTEAIDHAFEINTVYLDFQKAFDKVLKQKINHEAQRI